MVGNPFYNAFFYGVLVAASTIPSLLAAGLNNPQTVVVAVIDTGLDLQHPQLKPWIWTNPGEFGKDKNGMNKSLNGIDDDRNGYIDDIHGWDYVDSSPHIVDTNGHGTHVSGLIKNAFVEQSKQPSNLRILPLRYTEGTGRNSKDSFLNALKYAIEINADIINISASGHGFSKIEYDLLKEAEKKGILVVVATGNKVPGAPNYRSFPASYNLKNIWPVSALDKEGNPLPSANQIENPDVLFEVGENLTSALPGNSHGKKTGTSQATALISGKLAASLLHSVRAAKPKTKGLTLVMNPSNTLHN